MALTESQLRAYQALKSKSPSVQDIAARTLIFDGLNCFLRNFVVVPEMNANGDHVGGMIGTLRSVKAMVRETLPSRVLFIWDGQGGSQRRRGVMSEYKSGRKPRVNREFDFNSPEKSAENMTLQITKVKSYLDLLGVIQIEIDAIEADDVIALVCKHMIPNEEKVVVTTDKDMLQLVDAVTVVHSPTKKVNYTVAEMRDRLGVLPENWIYMKVLDGDNSDSVHVAGLKGLGPKTILKIYPILGERPTNLNEIFEISAAGSENKSVDRWMKKVIECREDIVKNTSLMQLTTPIISPQSVAKVRAALTSEREEFSGSKLRLAFLKDGLQVRDSDFESVFRGYHMRMKKMKEESKNVVS